jgi:transcriptional regulator with XRE-family HTH domain
VKKFSELSRKVYSDPARRARVEEHKARLMQAVTLAELRKARALTQVQLAKTLDTTQSGVSRIEHQTDVYLSTLRSFIEAMGGHLELSAIFPDGTVLISTFEDDTQQGEDRSNHDPASEVVDDLPVAR